ncbi:non-hydrolyzing UDP-N-acetylglucosamine 2-epimerase [Alkaliphilus hydrothermalis]|uniref:UDP-N-acetylglucosamine 2-epimerase (non-hydrolyzing) n=1 Tax=Alkaliphilus hydrothermalis TaxID=1482730 RepID=A0ABS2NQ97_9FIRM|nr:UDP-N-acetylglucosamine 2-epimerase (non-hydrolyzing) [Alkaliphilus hydrothermalis]MBM7615120.1 UDP-N-acetylglucosamine 2-epimerase (non-hydrolyzing) [Alkaliphilus hydrothermalis]
MKRLKVMSIFGTRPEAIKMAPLVKRLEKEEEIESVVCVTAQHREMLDMVLQIFDIKPQYDLNLMKHGQTISDITVGVLKGLEGVLAEAKPDIVLVHGDTSTTFVGALAAFYQKIKIGHMEAGLRTDNIYSPYPEEMNRRLTTTLTNFHFAPTKGNYENLIKNGVSHDEIHIVGNTVIDALLQVVQDDYRFEEEILNQIDYKSKKVIAMTCHRRENWGKPMENIFRAVRGIVERNREVEVVFPVHMNPAIRKLAQEILGGVEGIHLLEPLEYMAFANLLNKVDIIVTDSGGIQEEAPALGKPIVVVRTETERPEAVDAGTVKVVGVEEEDIVREVEILLKDSAAYEAMANAVNPYGDGKTCDRIVDVLLNYHKNN